MKIWVITCTGDRPEALNLCNHYMARQGHQDFTWIVVDDGLENSPRPRRADQFIKRARVVDDGIPTLDKNLMLALHFIEAELEPGIVLTVEDDDWYHAGYIGLIASRKRANLVLDYLAEEGVAKRETGRLHAPAGLDLGAVSPEEIAVSVISEMIALRNGGSGRPMRTRKPLGEAGGVDGCKGLFD